MKKIKFIILLLNFCLKRNNFLKIINREKVNGKLEIIQGEDHTSVALSGMLRGFRFINENFLFYT